MVDAPQDFQSKYTRTNFVTRRLLDGFFGRMEELLAGLDLSSAFEIGCGEGFSTQRLRQMLPAPVALEAADVEPRLVEAAQRLNPTVPVRQESIYQIRRPDRSVDIVFVLEVLEHLDDPAKALAEACRISRRWVLASVPREPVWSLLNLARLKYPLRLGNTPGHVQQWSARAFREFVGRAAQVQAVRTPLPWTMVLAEVR
jgi:SAM-dependent methyltransferase